LHICQYDAVDGVFDNGIILTAYFVVTVFEEIISKNCLAT